MRITTAWVFIGILAGCVNTTRPGAVGIERTQLLTAPSASVNQAAASLYSQATSARRATGQLNAHADDAERVRVVSNRLIQQVGIFRADASAWAWEINLFDDDVVNAACLPGGKIFVYRGLIQQLSLTDDELAAAIGHEIAHALREHGREKLSQQQLASAVVQGLANARSRYAATNAAIADLGSKIFVMLPYSRSMELEADVIGLELMTRAGYDPRAALTLQEKMLRLQGGPGRNDFFKTHPAGEFRVANLQTSMPKVLALNEPRQGTRVTTSGGTASSSNVALPVQAPPVPVRLVGIQFPSAEVAARPTEPITGRSSFSVERLARQNACSVKPVGILRERGAGYEVYSVECDGGGERAYRCEFGQCVAAAG